ncbi:stage III sporulation protein AF [Virgibacillus byunsanensis]|uniref:Stage III sporulation protein AF n=1 Tax=Virgibacillus byunsanensis TaxID=570945 RepID=A0ABW3LKL1_9BACI
MDILIQWITQIIIFVLLATIIDLLVPATAMKKYVKLVVGLILILIFLKPLFFLFDFNVQQALEASYEQLNLEQATELNTENLIELQKNEIQASQNAYIEEQMTVQLKDLAKGPLLKEFDAEIADIDYLFITETDLTYEGLEEVIVYLQESENGEGAVSVVDDVVINTDEPQVLEDEQDVEEIKALLENVWEFNNKKLTVLWEGGTP